jgi:hypothetical protein
MGQFPATRLASEKHALVPHRSPPPHEPSRRQSPAQSRRQFVTGLIALVVAASAGAVSHTSVARGEAGGAVFVREEDAPAEYRIQGEYRGELGPDHDRLQMGAQVIALGGDRFRGVFFRGGLPGDGWNRGGRLEVEGRAESGRVVFELANLRAVLENGAIRMFLDTYGPDDPVHEGTMARVERASPTLGMTPPVGAITLFDGSHAEAWTRDDGGLVTLDAGLLPSGVRSKRRFHDHTLHLEFRTPFQPAYAWQARGNSGVYVQGRYEVQILDSFGLSGEQNECGGIFGVARPDQHLCYPPLTWQTYDIDFRAARFETDGRMREPAQISVRHNGALIHDRRPLTRNTPGNPLAFGSEPGYVSLQEHGNPVRFRNVWVLEHP